MDAHAATKCAPIRLAQQDRPRTPSAADLAGLALQEQQIASREQISDATYHRAFDQLRRGVA
jgi:hypothetical protein